MPNLPFTNCTISIKRRSVTEGNKKEDSLIEENVAAFFEDTGTTADHEQTFLFMFNADDITSDVNPDTDTIEKDQEDYKIANASKRIYHYQIRAIKSI